MKYLKAAFRYLVPYMLYGEILYLSLKGVKDKSIFMFNGLFGYYSEMSRYLAWGLDIFFIVAGLGAIVYGNTCSTQRLSTPAERASRRR